MPSAAKARKRSQEMKEQGKAYFAQWEKQMAEVKNPEIQNLALARRAKLQEAFAAIAKVAEDDRLVSRRDGRGARLDEQRLAEQGLSIEQLVHQESQNQASDQMSISHTIGSLRFLSATDWREFVEDLSVVDQTLRTDPAAVYSEMDFATRDRYRHSVEAIARHCQFSEMDVARRAIQLAEIRAREKGIHDRTAHVGYYLIDKGQAALERETAVSLGER